MNFIKDENLIFQFITRRKKKTFYVILFGVFSNLLTILIPVSIGKYYDLFFNFNSQRARVLDFIPDYFWESIPNFLIFFSGLVIFRYLFFVLYQYNLKKESEILVKNIKDYLFKNQLHIKYNIYREQGIGKYLLRYTGDINSLKNLYLKGSIRFAIDVIMIMTSFFWFYKLNKIGAVIITLASLFSYVIIRFLNHKVEYYSLQKRNKSSSQLSYVSRALNSILSIKLLNKEITELKKFKKKSTDVRDLSILYDFWFVLNKGFISFAQYFILSIILYIFYLEYYPSQANIQAGNLISFILLYITILPVLRRLFSLETVFKLGNISIQKLNKIIELEKEDKKKGVILTTNNPRVLFENVSYDNLPTINFISKKMEICTLTIPSGFEKLQIIFFLTKISTKYKGIIKINDTDIRNISIQSLRANISYFSPTLPLAGRTVYEAITAYRTKSKKNKITNQFNLIQSIFILNQPLKIDDNIGENGIKLSKLQYELLCLIRGIVSEKKIIILDEFHNLKNNNPQGFWNIINSIKATIIKLELE